MEELGELEGLCDGKVDGDTGQTGRTGNARAWRLVQANRNSTRFLCTAHSSTTPRAFILYVAIQYPVSLSDWTSPFTPTFSTAPPNAFITYSLPQNQLEPATQPDVELSTSTTIQPRLLQCFVLKKDGCTQAGQQILLSGACFVDISTTCVRGGRLQGPNTDETLVTVCKLLLVSSKS